MAVEILVPIAFFAATFGMFYLYIMSRNRERMAMIERGTDLGLFQHKESKNANFLRFGFLALGAGLGLVIGMIIAPYIQGARGNNVVISTTLIFGGLFLIIGYFVEIKLNRKNNSNDLLNIK
jgi:hypothetical protein